MTNLNARLSEEPEILCSSRMYAAALPSEPDIAESELESPIAASLLKTSSTQAVSPVQAIQDKLESEFSNREQGSDHVAKDLRLIGFGFSIVFSILVWTLIVRFLIWVF